VPAIIALALIPGARQNIRSSGGAVQGEGLLTAAKVIALINIGLSAIIAILVVLGLVASSHSGTYGLLQSARCAVAT
jgi:hypothetical protein